MTRVWIALALALLIGTPVVASEPWLESRHDPARSGRTADPGPAFNETALVVELPGPRALTATPVILDGSVYVLTQNLRAYERHGYNETGRNALWRIDLETGERAAVFEFEDRGFARDWPTLVSDGTVVYVITRARIDAYDPASGSTRTVWETRQTVPGATWGWVCNPPTIDMSVLYLGCMETTGATDAGAPYDPLGGFAPLLFAIELDGQEDASTLWRRVVPPTRPHGAQEDPHPPSGTDPCDALAVEAPIDPSQGCQSAPILLGHSLLEGLVVAALTSGAPLDEGTPDPAPTTNEAVLFDGALAAFDAATGDLVWTRHHPTVGTVIEDASIATRPEYRVWDRLLKVEVTGAEGQLFSREPDLVWLNAGDGTRLGDPVPVSDGDWTLTAQAPGFALDGDVLFVTSEQYVHAYDWRTRERVAESRSPLRGDTFYVLPDLVVAGEMVYAKSATLARTASGGWGRFDSVSNHLHALALEGDEIIERWRMDFAGGFSPNILWLTFGVGDGLLVTHGLDGQVTIVGRTNASIQLDVQVSTQWPDVGERVVLDPSQTGAGAMGEPTAFRVDWGDGNASAWQDAPLFRHAYATGGERTAMLWARNEAGQTSAQPVVLGVGLTPPGSGGLVVRAFARDNQDLTFGILGIALALGGGAIAVGRQLARRRRVQREIAEVERTFDRTHGRPSDCEAALAARRAHVRDLALRGRLEQGELLVVERRIDELALGLRLDAIDEHFPFLPIGVARQLREMLADGRITQWEREHFLAALDEDVDLTQGQKKKVRAQIDAWFARDGVQADRTRAA